MTTDDMGQAIFSNNEMYLIAAALEAAAETYLADASRSDGRLAEQFKRQSAQAKKLSEEIHSHGW